MAVRPTVDTPDWFPTDPATMIEPTDTKKGAGWLAGEPLPAQNFNWLLNSISKWLEYFKSQTVNETVDAYDDYTILATDAGKILRVVITDESFTLNLPDPATFEGGVIRIKEVSGLASIFPVSIHRFADETFEMLAADYLLEADYGQWAIFCDGTNWYLI